MIMGSTARLPAPQPREQCRKSTADKGLRHCNGMMADQRGPHSHQGKLGDGTAGTQWNLQTTLPTANHAVRLARQATRDALATWRLATLAETAVLLVSELVTNAVWRARGGRAITWNWKPTEPGWDSRSPMLTRARGTSHPSRVRVVGFGLVLVDALTGNGSARDRNSARPFWASLKWHFRRAADLGKPAHHPERTSTPARWHRGQSSRLRISSAVCTASRPISRSRRAEFRGAGPQTLTTALILAGMCVMRTLATQRLHMAGP